MTGGVLAAIALVVLNPQPARADPAVPATPSGLSPQISTGGSAEADRDFLVRVRLARLYPELGGSGLSEADRDFLVRVRLAGLYPELGGSGLSRADRDFLIKVRLASLAA